MRVFLLSQDYDGSPLYYLKKREVQYLEKVLRLEKGTVFTAKDTSDNYYEAKLEDEGTLLLKPTDNPEDTLLDSLSGYSGPFAPIDVYVSILKGKKNESVVRALTEIGVRKIIFMDTDNAQEHDFSSHQKERLENRKDNTRHRPRHQRHGLWSAEGYGQQGRDGGYGCHRHAP